MNLDFGKYTECTELAKEIDSGHFGDYEKVFICPDTRNFWVCKILVGYDEEYNQDESSTLIERNNIEDFCARNLRAGLEDKELAMLVLEADAQDGCNWDVTQCDSLDEAVEHVDGGFGINE